MKVEKEHKRLRLFILSEYRSLVLYVRRYLNEKYYDVSAEDIVQDVAVNLFSKLDFDEQLENIAGYVYRSIRNKITDFQRKKKKEVPFHKFTDDEGEKYFSENIEEIQETGLSEINDENFYPVLNKFMRNWKDEYKKERKCRDWRHFDDFWWDEGEKSYNDYLERRKEQE